MGKLNFQKAIQFGQSVGSGGDTKPTYAPLSIPERENWNKFIDFVDSKGLKGHPSLDKRDQSVGMGLIQQYNQLNPKAPIDPNYVPRVQADLQNYRTNVVNQWKAGKIVPQAGQVIRTEADIMPNISPIDGWLGSRTSSYKYPAASANNSDGTVTNYGVNTEKFDKDRGIK